MAISSSAENHSYAVAYQFVVTGALASAKNGLRPLTRAAIEKGRGTCGNTLSVRKGVLETAALSVLENDLLTDEHTRMLAHEFARAVDRVEREDNAREEITDGRPRQIGAEIANLTQNMLAGVLGPTLQHAVAEREAEKARLMLRLAAVERAAPNALPAVPVLMNLFRTKLGKLRASLDDEAFRPEAAQLLTSLILGSRCTPAVWTNRRRRSRISAEI